MTTIDTEGSKKVSGDMACKRFPWLREFVGTGRSAINEVTITVATNELFETYPTLGVPDSYSGDAVHLIDGHGKKIGRVGTPEGFRAWKFWMWVKAVNFDEKIGEAIRRCPQTDYIAEITYKYGGDQPKITVYTAEDGKSIHQMVVS